MSDKITIEVTKEQLDLITFGLLKASQYFYGRADALHDEKAEWSRVAAYLTKFNQTDDLQGELKAVTHR